jgi:hypothetical protein
MAKAESGGEKTEKKMPSCLLLLARAPEGCYNPEKSRCWNAVYKRSVRTDLP